MSLFAPAWMTPELRRYRMIINLTGALCCAVGSALLWLGIETTFQSRRSAMETSLQEQHQLAGQTADLQIRLQQLHLEENRLQQQLTENRRRIPGSADEVQFLEQIAEHAERCGVKIQEFLPGSVTSFRDHQRTEIQLTATTDYQGFCEFLFAIRSMERLFDIRECRLQSTDPVVDQQILNVTFGIFHAPSNAVATSEAEVRR